MTNSPSSICVFCGASASPDPVFTSAAWKLGELLAKSGITLIYGAGQTGMMGALAQGTLENKGKVIGVTHKLESLHASHFEGLNRFEIMDTLPERKARLGELADAFIVLPGGYGTLDEFSEVLIWAQIGLHNKPIALFNIKGYFDGLLTWIERADKEHFIRSKDRILFIVDDDPERLLNRLGVK